MKHRFLYLSFFFPPLGGAEPRHNLSIVRRLYSNGFLPTVVTAPEDYPYPKDEYLRSLIPQGLDIIRCNWPYENEKKIRFARRIIKIPENPFVFSGWKNLYNPAHEIMKRNDFDFIYSVHGIGAAHIAALRLKKEFGLPWIAEFRDPWIDNVVAWNYMRNNSWGWWCNREMKRTRKLLDAILTTADLVVVDSPMHAEQLIRVFDVGEEIIVPLGMGYEEDYFKEVEAFPLDFQKKPIIGFVGSVYQGYDYAVENLVKSLKDLQEEGFEFTLISIGDASNLFSQYADKEKLRNFLPISRVNYTLALGLMSLLDFGIILGPKSYKLIVNSKIWEYLKFNLSILAVVPSDSMAARIIEEGDCGYILPYENKSMLQALRQVLIDYSERKTKKPKHDYVEQFSSEKMVGKLAERIEELL